MKYLLLSHNSVEIKILKNNAVQILRDLIYLKLSLLEKGVSGRFRWDLAI